MNFQVKRGLEASRLGITPLNGELLYTTDNKELFIGDGTTAGGIKLTEELFNTTYKGKLDNLSITGAVDLDSIKALAESALQSTDVIDDLTTGGIDVPLSAEQGKFISTKLNYSSPSLGIEETFSFSSVGDLIQIGNGWVITTGSGEENDIFVRIHPVIDPSIYEETFIIMEDQGAGVFWGEYTFLNAINKSYTIQIYFQNDNGTYTGGIGFYNLRPVVPVKVVDNLTNDNTMEALSANQGMVLKGLIDSLSTGMTYQGTFDASVGTLPVDVIIGQFWKVSVAGTVGTLEMAIGDMLIANTDVEGSTVDSNFDKIDNTEAADLVRTGDISTNTDLTVAGTKLTDRTTMKSVIDNLTGDLANLTTTDKTNLVAAINEAMNSSSTTVVNDLTTGGINDALSAEQGKVLKGLVDPLILSPKLHDISGNEPDSDYDINSGYKIGDLAFDSGSGLWLCDSNLAGAATWSLLALSSDLGQGNATVYSSDTFLPTVTDDNSSGYHIGDLWVYTPNNVVYFAKDTTPGAAIWLPVVGNSTLVSHTSVDLWNNPSTGYLAEWILSTSTPMIGNNTINLSSTIDQVSKYNGAIGAGSVVFHTNNSVIGSTGFAIGSYNSIANGNNAFVSGRSNEVSGDNASAFGLDNQAYMSNSVVFGKQSTAASYQTLSQGEYVFTGIDYVTDNFILDLGPAMSIGGSTTFSYGVAVSGINTSSGIYARTSSIAVPNGEKLFAAMGPIDYTVHDIDGAVTFIDADTGTILAVYDDYQQDQNGLWGDFGSYTNATGSTVNVSVVFHHWQYHTITRMEEVRFYVSRNELPPEVTPEGGGTVEDVGTYQLFISDGLVGHNSGYFYKRNYNHNISAIGVGLVGKNAGSHTIGTWNIGSSADTLVEVGNGTSHALRSNALEIYKDGTLTAPSSSIVNINAKGAKALVTKEYVDAISVGSFIYQTTFDASTGILPPDITKGTFWKVSVAGIIGTLDLAIGDMLIANTDVEGSTVDSNFDKIDNTESADILRDGDVVSSNIDFNNTNPTKLTDRQTIKFYVDDYIQNYKETYIQPQIDLINNSNPMRGDGSIFYDTTAPTNTDDSSANFYEGDLYVHIISPTETDVYVCSSEVIDNAVWTRVNTGLVNDLTTGGINDALSAEQGKVLKGLYDSITPSRGNAGIFKTTTTPTNTDDSSQGYLIGDIWIKSSPNYAQVYVCTNNSLDDALWLKITTNSEGRPWDGIYDSTQVINAGSVPSATDDENNFINPGDLWVNSLTGYLYVCMDSTATAAVWSQLGGGTPTSIDCGTF